MRAALVVWFQQSHPSHRPSILSSIERSFAGTASCQHPCKSSPRGRASRATCQAAHPRAQKSDTPLHPHHSVSAEGAAYIRRHPKVVSQITPIFTAIMAVMTFCVLLGFETEYLFRLNHWSARRSFEQAPLVVRLMNLWALAGLFLLTRIFQDLQRLSPPVSGPVNVAGDAAAPAVRRARRKVQSESECVKPSRSRQ